MKLTIDLEKIGKKLTKQWLAVVAAYVVIFPLAGALGMGNAPLRETQLEEVQPEKAANETENETANETAGEREEDAVLAEKSESETSDPLQSLYENLPQDQKQLLEDIRKSMETKDMTQTAKLLDKKQEVLAELFYGTFEGQRFLYDGNGVSSEIEGVGLVFTMPEIVFYGTFENGHPQGSCLALQFINVDSPRYNYSDGIWDNGKMNGQGTTGYCYYENIPQGENAWAVKTGGFVDDQLEGDIVYEIKGSDESVSHWNMLISQGKLQLDDRWTHLDDMGEYQLMSSDSVSHAYIIADDQLEQLLWMNLLGWE